MRIGIFGGSFNPIHNGHIALGTTMLSAMSLNEVWFLVSPLNPWKEGDPHLLDENIRLKLTQIALEDYPGLIASDYEFRLPKPNYTWKTLQQLKKDFPQHEFILIIGGDNLAEFDHWANYKYILENFHIAVFPREGYSLKPSKGITVIDVPKINITSTMIRTMIHNKQDISPYVPKKIAQQAPPLYCIK